MLLLPALAGCLGESIGGPEQASRPTVIGTSITYTIEGRVAPTTWPDLEDRFVDVRTWDLQSSGVWAHFNDDYIRFLPSNRELAIFDAWRYGSSLPLPVMHPIHPSNGSLDYDHGAIRLATPGEEKAEWTLSTGAEDWTFQQSMSNKQLVVEATSSLEKQFNAVFAAGSLVLESASFADPDGLVWNISKEPVPPWELDKRILKPTITKSIVEATWHLAGGATPRETSGSATLDREADVYAAFAYQCDGDALRQVPHGGAKIDFSADGAVIFTIACNAGKAQENGYALVCPNSRPSTLSIEGTPSPLTQLPARFAGKWLSAHHERYQIQSLGGVHVVVAIDEPATSACGVGTD